MNNGLSRRAFLKSTAVAGGGFVLVGSFQLLADNAPALAKLNAWVRIGTDGVVTVVVSQTEIGQGITTTLPAALVEELGADWSRVRFETAPVAPAYQNPERHWQFTGNSESTASFFALMQKMGAAAREMLVGAAAERWGVSPDRLTVEKGVITDRVTGKKLRFGEVAADAAKRTPPENPRIKTPAEWTLIGKPIPRVDVPGKVDGSARFGIDYTIPGLVNASIKRVPTPGGRVKSYDAAAVKSMPGVIDVIALPNGVAVVAEKYWQARRAAEAMPIAFEGGTNLDSEALEEKYRAALESPGWNRVVGQGALAGEKSITREYQSQFLAHATMEPMNCAARVANGEVDIWAPTQGPELTQVTLAALLGIPREKIRIHILLAGGGFGRRLLPDFAVEAALLSRAVGGRPVKVIWSREEDILHDHYRPATLHRITASLDELGQPSAVRHQLVSPTILFPVFPPLAGSAVDPSCCEGLMETRYQVPNWSLDFKLLKIPIQTSVLRTTGYGPNIFAWESFIDELAHDAGKDPYEFRRALLAHDARATALLDLVADRSDWRKPQPGRGRGIAFCDAFGSLLAQVVELSVSRDRKVRVHRVTNALDAGRVLDRRITSSSIEGGVIWGLSAAFKSAISFRDGRAAQSNYHDFQIVRMNEVPERIDVHFIDSGAKIGGVGEVGPVTIPPAVANAIFAATGERIRSLPLSKHGFTLA